MIEEYELAALIATGLNFDNVALAGANSAPSDPGRHRLQSSWAICPKVRWIPHSVDPARPRAGKLPNRCWLNSRPVQMGSSLRRSLPHPGTFVPYSVEPPWCSVHSRGSAANIGLFGLSARRRFSVGGGPPIGCSTPVSLRLARCWLRRSVNGADLVCGSCASTRRRRCRTFQSSFAVACSSVVFASASFLLLACGLDLTKRHGRCLAPVRRR